jgi:glucose-6-phosphate isomerase
MEKIINIEYASASSFLGKEKMKDAIAKASSALKILENRTGRGNDFLGWIDLPTKFSKDDFEKISNIVTEWRKKLEVVVIIGIGGSYLGAKAAIEYLSNPFQQHLGKGEYPALLFAGQNMSEDYLSELISLLDKREYGVVVISKSGTTTEPAVAFRIIKKHIEDKYGKRESSSRIVAITDSSKGALRELSNKEGYRTFSIPDDVGGRFSVLTPVGILPIAIAGFNIEAMLNGAAAMKKYTSTFSEDNPALIYAALRNAMYQSGKKIELFVNFNPKLQFVAEWWKQLFGESEGKEGKGIFPASVNFTTDLHSMGQYIQEGERILFETIVSVEDVNNYVVIGSDPQNLDGLNFLSGKRVEECNKMAELGTRIAHVDGGVPNIRISVKKLDEYSLGAIFYFFEKACGISAYILNVNPFDQPGVEEYKVNMFALLGKPGFEDKAKELRSRNI